MLLATSSSLAGTKRDAEGTVVSSPDINNHQTASSVDRTPSSIDRYDNYRGILTEDELDEFHAYEAEQRKRVADILRDAHAIPGIRCIGEECLPERCMMSGIGGLFLDKPFIRKEYPHKDATVAIVLKENYGDTCMATDPENAPSLLSFRNERDRTSFLATMIASSDNLEVRESAICETHFFYLANLLDCLPTVAKIHDRAVSFLHAVRVLAVKGGPIKTVTFADVSKLTCRLQRLLYRNTSVTCSLIL